MKAIYLFVPLIGGVILDLILGDPHWLYHPVRLIGKIIIWMEKGLRCVFPKDKSGEVTAGRLLALLVPLLFLGVSGLILHFTWQLSPWIWLILETIFFYQLIAVKDLKSESMAVYSFLVKNDVDSARIAVSRIVGRDTENLDRTQVIKAAVETVAESISDGIIAPMLYMAIGGAPLCFWYKAVNTLDSMVGYKNDKYLYFGRGSARLDDIAGFLPARLGALSMLAASLLCGFDYKNAYRILRRDRFSHQSPNSAHTEAVCAGALNIELAGDAYYFGELRTKPVIGDWIREPVAEDIRSANQLMLVATILFLTVCVLLRALILLILL